MSADRIGSLVRRIFRHAIDTTTPGQQVQLEALADEPHRDVEVLAPFGVESVPTADVDEGLAVFVGGESDHGVVLGWFDKSHRPKGLVPGEVKFYCGFGQTIFLDKLGQVIVTSASGSTTTLLANGDIEHAPSSQKMRVIGQLEVTKGITAVEGISSQGDIHANGDVTADVISLRTHKTTGVQPGAGLSGNPT